MKARAKYEIAQQEIGKTDEMPSWVRSFFINVLKRCAGILVHWIEAEVEEKPKSNNKTVRQ